MKNLQKITYLGKEVSIDDFKDSSITYEMLSNMSMNSYARTAIYPKLTTEALIKVSKDTLKQCTPILSTPVTYDESIIKSLFPEVIERISDDDTKFNDIRKRNLEAIGSFTLQPEEFSYSEFINLKSNYPVSLSPDTEEPISFEENLSLRSQLSELSEELLNDVADGECFYDSEMFEAYKKNLEQLNELSLKYFLSNKNDI